MKTPAICIGVRIASLAIASDARPLAIGLCAWDVSSMRYISSYFGVIDVNDPETKDKFFVDPSTLDWWEGHHAASPDREAYRACWNGGRTMREIMTEVVDFVEGFKEHERVLICKPPAFDMPILGNAFAFLGNFRGMFAKPTLVDSGHTIERGLETLGFAAEGALEPNLYSFGQSFVGHHPRFESAKIAYTGARYYHLLHVLKKHGYERAVATHEKMQTGDYDGITGLGA